MPSFDVISKISYPEFDNALANCLREIGNRFDFKGLDISIERKDKIITTLAPDALKLKQVNELLQVHLIRRKVDPRVIVVKNSENAAGSSIRQVSELEEGISQENAKKIIGNKIIGITCHNSIKLAKAAIKEKASYIAFGAFFSTKTKKVKFKAKIEILNKAKKLSQTPIVAIGGININNYKKLLLNNANLLAISGYVWNNKKYKPLETIEKLK